MAADNDREDRIAELRAILLGQERGQIAALREVLDNKKQLATRVSPIIEERLDTLKTNFSQELGSLVDNAITTKLDDSREALLDLIYPVLGRMIRKFVAQQMEELKNSIDAQTSELLSAKRWSARLKAQFLGVKESAVLLSALGTAQIEEIYAIQHHSGLLLGAYSRGKTIDQDMIAGMLTAIKAFAQDAFGRGTEDLEQIEYGSYKILLVQGNTQYYMAMVVSGALSANDRQKLTDDALNFINIALSEYNFEAVNSTLQSLISKQIKQHFNAYLHDN